MPCVPSPRLRMWPRIPGQIVHKEGREQAGDVVGEVKPDGCQEDLVTMGGIVACHFHACHEDERLQRIERGFDDHGA